MGEVFKLRDLTLDRIVAGKVIRRDPRAPAGVGEFLREARSMALFADRRIVRIFEFRPDADPPVIIMEHVEGFELGRIGPSLEFAQRARILIDICGALEHAHALGLQHRDLKPSNIMLDAQLAPRILDFGLSSGHPFRGHLKGTLHYVAPEQLDPSQPIDRRTDVYALGVVLYELLCGRPAVRRVERRRRRSPPSGRASPGCRSRSIRACPNRCRRSRSRPWSATRRCATSRRSTSAPTCSAISTDGRCLARPSVYASTLGMRVAPHVQQIGEWLRLRLIYPHEAERLRSAYRALDAREDDWIVESRALSYSQIALYLGAFLLVCGSLFYFAAHRWYDAVRGVAAPLLVLGLPFAGLNAAAHHLYRRDHKAVAVAFFLAAVGPAAAAAHHPVPRNRLPRGRSGHPGPALSGWIDLEPPAAGHVAPRLPVVRRAGAPHAHRGAQHGVRDPRLLLWPVSVLSDLGLRSWLEDGRWDLLALNALPLVAVYAGLGSADGARAAAVVREAGLCGRRAAAHRRAGAAGARRPDLSLPRVLAPVDAIARASPIRLLLDTLAAMTLNGIGFYALASALDRHGTELQATAARLLFTLSPFAILQPLGYLVRTAEYSPRYDWIYLASRSSSRSSARRGSAARSTMPAC